jgi:hypothetical protein
MRRRMSQVSDGIDNVLGGKMGTTRVNEQKGSLEVSLHRFIVRVLLCRLSLASTWAEQYSSF